MTAAGIESATFRFVAQHINHCATAVPLRVLVLSRYFTTQECSWYLNCLVREDGSDILFQNVGNKKPTPYNVPDKPGTVNPLTPNDPYRVISHR